MQYERSDMMNIKFKKGLKKAYKKFQKYASPSTYRPYYPLPSEKGTREYQEAMFWQSEESWKNQNDSDR